MRTVLTPEQHRTLSARLAELSEVAKRWRAARAWVLEKPERLARLDDATASAVCEDLPGGES